MFMKVLMLQQSSNPSFSAADMKVLSKLSGISIPDNSSSSLSSCFDLPYNMVQIFQVQAQRRQASELGSVRFIYECSSVLSGY